MSLDKKKKKKKKNINETSMKPAVRSVCLGFRGALMACALSEAFLPHHEKKISESKTQKFLATCLDAL